MAEEQLVVPGTKIPLGDGYRFYRLEKVSSFAMKALNWAGVLMLAWIVADAATSFAGKDSKASLFVEILANIGVNVTLAYSAVGGCTIWALLERKFRRDKTTTLSERIQELEKEKDPTRTSSNLTPTGQTRPEDK